MDLGKPNSFIGATALYFNQSIIHRCKSKEINQKAKRPKKSGLLIGKAKRDFDFSPTKMDVFLKSIQ